MLNIHKPTLGAYDPEAEAALYAKPEGLGGVGCDVAVVAVVMVWWFVVVNATSSFVFLSLPVSVSPFSVSVCTRSTFPIDPRKHVIARVEG